MNCISKLWTWFDSWVEKTPPLEQPTLMEWVIETEDRIHQRNYVILGSPFLFPFGYDIVMFTGLMGFGLLWYQHFKVSAARKQYEEMLLLHNTQSDPLVLNYTYRAYRGTKKMFPSFIFLLMTGGLDMPYFSSVGGFIWILGRLVYSYGYYTGVPANRRYGSFYMIGYLILLFTSGRWALRRMLDVE